MNAIEMLDSQVCLIKFIKADHSIREMTATRNLAYIPVTDHPKGVKKPSDKVVTVYDLDIGDWRCFSKARLISIE
jgi:hypothetical protein